MTIIDRDYEAERDYDGPKYAYPPRFMPRPTWVLVSVASTDSLYPATHRDSDAGAVIGPFDSPESARAYYRRYSASWAEEPVIVGLWAPLTEEVNA